MLEKSDLRVIYPVYKKSQPTVAEGDPGWDLTMANYEKHTLPTDMASLESFMVMIVIAGSHGQGESKDLVMHSRPTTGEVWFSVLDHQEEIYQGCSFQEAVKTYNQT